MACFEERLSLLCPKRRLSDRLRASTLGLSEDDYQRLKGRFRVKRLVDICLTPMVVRRKLLAIGVGLGVRYSPSADIPTLAEIQIFLTAYPRTKGIKKRPPLRPRPQRLPLANGKRGKGCVAINESCRLSESGLERSVTDR